MTKSVCLIFLIFGLCTFTYSQTDVNTASQNDSSRFFYFPAAKIPTKSGTCVLASLARKQSKLSIFDILRKFLKSQRIYGKCPTQDELRQFNDDEEFKQRIFGGTEAQFGQYPWMVYMYELESCSPVCGGTLLNSNWVLTAGHCIVTNRASLYGLVVGEHRISTLNSNEKHRLVRKILIHPEYDPLSLNNDVALLQLQRPIFYSRFIRPACLPPSGTGTDRLESPTLIGDPTCTAMGWGITETGGEATDVLMSVRLRIAPDFLCESVSRETSVDSPAVLGNEAKFCAGGEVNRDTCMYASAYTLMLVEEAVVLTSLPVDAVNMTFFRPKGDSGGPLICAINETYNIVGVTSYGPNPCGQVGRFGVYAKVADPIINNWIRSIIFR